jgi:hypothetical protein
MLQLDGVVSVRPCQLFRVYFHSSCNDFLLSVSRRSQICALAIFAIIHFSHCRDSTRERLTFLHANGVGEESEPRVFCPFPPGGGSSDRISRDRPSVRQSFDGGVAISTVDRSIV